MSFKKKTVFILGAGASEKFPLGGALVRHIVEDSGAASSAAFKSIGVSEKLFSEFLSHLKFADPSSIDAFLEENPDLINVGRVAIAYRLMCGENENKLFPPESSANNWYKTFVDSIGITKTGKPAENNITIFTYNYERSLEHYLTRVIQNRMRISEDEAINIRIKIPIFHLHGSLGSLDKNDRNYRDYTQEVNEKTLRIASESIKIIHEQSDDYDCKKELKNAFLSAEQIYFFGFGYHPVNMRRLMNSGLREKLKKSDGCKIVSLRWSTPDHIWKKILMEQFENLIPFDNESANSIASYLLNYGFDLN